MTHPERVEDYLEHIADAIERAMRYIGNLENLQALEQNQQAQDAIVRTLAVIGEAANRISKVAPDFVSNHAELPLCSAIIDAAADPSVMRFIRKRCGMIGGC